MSPSKFRLRRVFRIPVLKAAAPFIKYGVHPNTITYLSLLIAFAGFLILGITQNQLVYGVFVFLVGFFDGVDGAVARGSGKASTKGAFTDSFIDKVSEAVLLFSIPISFPTGEIFGLSLDAWAYLCFTGWLLTSYSRARAESIGLSDLDVGLGARSERLFILSILSILSLVEVGLVVVTAIGIGTAVYRFIYYQRLIPDVTSK